MRAKSEGKPSLPKALANLHDNKGANGLPLAESGLKKSLSQTPHKLFL
jgi:hypothetical protein